MNEFEFSGFAEVEEPVRKSKRPAVILVLGILSIVYCSFSIFFAPISIYQKHQLERTYEIFGSFGGGYMMDAIRDYTPGLWTDISFALLSCLKIIAIVFLLRMKKFGLWSYAILDLTVVGLTIYTSILSMQMASALQHTLYGGIGFGMMGGFGGLSLGGVFWIFTSIVFSAGFIFSYASQYKRME